jgi:L-threonylcarbamoyladenylate synthase
MAQTGNDLAMAAKFLLNGGLVAIPTETVYGLAANALDEKAVLKIFEAKRRPFFDPLIVHVPSLEAARLYAHFHDERLTRLARKFWPGPLTLLLPKKDVVPNLVTSGLPRVAIRVPQHPLTLQLLRELQIPLAAPSANPFGYISPTQPAHVLRQLGEKIDYILDGGTSNVGIESTILGIEEDRICVYRLGGLSIEDIEKVSGKVNIRVNASSDPRAPGQLKSHYAPTKPLFVGDVQMIMKDNPGKIISVICFGEPPVSTANHLYNLSEKRDDKEAALNLFRLLRLADEDDSEMVICEPLPDSGLGMAINDRLQRAAS